MVNFDISNLDYSILTEFKDWNIKGSQHYWVKKIKKKEQRKIRVLFFSISMTFYTFIRNIKHFSKIRFWRFSLFGVTLLFPPPLSPSDPCQSSFYSVWLNWPLKLCLTLRSNSCHVKVNDWYGKINIWPQND